MRRTHSIGSLLAAAALAGAPAALGAVRAPDEAVRRPAQTVANETNKAVVVQIVARRIQVRAIDGVATWLTLALKPEITLNGYPAQITDLRKGFVVETTLNSRGRIVVLKAVGRLPVQRATGAVSAVDASQVTVRRLADGLTTTVRVGTPSAVTIDGTPATLADLVPRMRVVVRWRGPEPAFRIDAERVLVTDRGTIETIDANGLQLRLAGGLLVPVPLAPTTLVRIGATRLGTPTDLRIGGLAEVQHLTGGPALVIRLPRTA